MSEPKTLPPSLRGWAQRHVSEIVTARDASQSRPKSQVWELRNTAGARHVIKVSPSAAFYRRETFAYRHAAIDFERAQFAPLVKDFVILAATAWLEAPILERAFFHGYGRQLTSEEKHVPQCLIVLDAVSCLAWGPSHRDDEVTARGRRTLTG
ncbi:hypothetical protein [Streptomyces sp. NBC_01089]|uniref:hypothetical protein n=1 Tax=Streptomyces sp. NBC_01089 TaxID=2903747 RepID=UPI00386CFF1D|nr:hypothetical protein OG510_33160 [Streptomyces sp. NBC_01089]